MAKENAKEKDVEETPELELRIDAGALAEAYVYRLLDEVREARLELDRYWLTAAAHESGLGYLRDEKERLVLRLAEIAAEVRSEKKEGADVVVGLRRGEVTVTLGALIDLEGRLGAQLGGYAGLLAEALTAMVENGGEGGYTADEVLACCVDRAEAVPSSG